ncbi:MCM family protein [Methanocaldococcus vulcanius M7]|uniref:MCM family protein n=1 Tax=Methanocaldococcus vulcanius (strain ATCC 700851 / DSM 12094 / M7) TaxID=579137 RepID=C9RGB9_METVM|nr:minichromosome maintenance protein MCM [Methanocaldococcus vulcanius]ACX72621.1 MCM family protein [Methanocaldococcus vulcanius M7]
MEFQEEINLEEFKDYLIAYLRNTHQEDIVMDSEVVVVDLNNLYYYGLMEFVDYLIHNPQKGIDFIKECYESAYFTLKNEYPKNFIISVKNLPKIFKTNKNGKLFTVEDIKSNTLGKIVEFEGIIVMASKIRPILKKAYYFCPKCGKSVIKEVDFLKIAEEKEYCECKSELNLIEEKSTYTDFQEIKVQQPLDLMDNPEEPPKYITVFLENSPGIYAGRVKITGIPVKIKKSKKLPIYEIYVKALHCEVLDGEVKVKITREDVKNIEKIAKRNDVVDILADRLIPEIRGHSAIKKAVFLQQIKGVKKPGKRADIHILLITDPGIGKTVILRKIAEIPGNLYGSVTTATGVGLTAAVVREKTEIGEDTWVIKPGLLVKAHKGTACIDELTVNKDLQSYVLEAMESQTIHISKGGINAKLPAECAILAACNPRWGRFNPEVSVAEQINIPAPLLSRFDLIFPIRDESDRDKDKDIAEYIIDLHRAYLDEKINKKMGLDYLEIDGVKIDKEFIIKYIHYARQKKPIISEKAKELFVKYYVEMRKRHQITARQLEASIRIAEAHAKAKLKDVVDEEDAKEAINIITECLKEIAYDPETGTFDVDKILGVSKKERDKLTTVYEIIKELSEKSELVEHEDIVEEAKNKGIKENEVENIIKKLIKYGDIDEPKPGRYRLL